MVRSDTRLRFSFVQVFLFFSHRWKSLDLARFFVTRWYWRGKPKGAGEMENAIATRPIGIHKYKETRMIRELDQHFYGPKDNIEIMKLNPRSRAFIDKVRKNLGIDE
jgi:hypothetical protein